MLRDEIEKRKREDPGSLRTMTGGCRFCGQIASLEVPMEWDNEMVDEAATELCTCFDAQDHAGKKRKKEKGVAAVEKQFGTLAADSQIAEEVKELLTRLVDLAVEDKISSGTIDIGDGLKAKISITAKGKVKVERSKTEKVTQEG